MTCLGEDMEAEVDAGCIMEYLWMLVMIIAALLSCSIGITTIRQVSVEITNNNRRMSLYRAKMQEWVVVVCRQPTSCILCLIIKCLPVVSQ